MVRVVQYPDVLHITRVTEGYQDADGNWIDGATKIITFECRFVPNSSGAVIPTQDGGNYLFKYKIALPIGTTNIKEGDSYNRNGEEGVITRFEVGQLHSVAWV